MINKNYFGKSYFLDYMMKIAMAGTSAINLYDLFKAIY